MGEKESCTCRNYENGDEYQILNLFREAFNEEESLDFWRWKFMQGPFGKGIIKLLFDGEMLIGHYAAIPMNVLIKNTIIRAICSIDSMTHPDYRGKSVFSHLAKKFYKECEQRGFRFVYGFPNQSIYPIRIRKLAWRGLGKMSILCKEVEGKDSTIVPLTEDATFQTQKIENFGDDINSLWHKVKEDYNVIIPRTKEFLNWRFVDRPDVNYTKYIITNSNAETLGYIVLKIHAAKDEVKGHIIDILSLNNEKIVKELINCALNYFIERDVNIISCWMQDDYFYADVLKKEKFSRKEIGEPYPYFGVKLFNEVSTEVKTVEDVNSWYLTMGDCDVF